MPPSGSWMDDRDNILEDLYVLWVEVQVLHWVNEDQSEEYGGDLTNITGAPSEGASPGVALGVVGGRRSVHPSVASSLGDGPGGQSTGQRGL